MALIPPTAFDCVVAIGQKDTAGQLAANATGFLFGRAVNPGKKDGNCAVFLVTNRHVFEGLSEVALRFNPEGGKPGRIYDLQLVDDKGSPLWRSPTDPEIDVAVISINAKRLGEHGIKFSAFIDEHHVLNLKAAQASGISEGDGVFVLGFPLGNAGAVRNHVIVRHGIIARVRDYLAGEAKTILVDSTIYPGNSGGPVLSRPELTAISGTKADGRSMLIGLVSSYIPYIDVAISQQTKRPRVTFEENTGLSNVQPIQFVQDLIEQMFAAQQRDNKPGAA